MGWIWDNDKTVKEKEGLVIWCHNNNLTLKRTQSAVVNQHHWRTWIGDPAGREPSTNSVNVNKAKELVRTSGSKLAYTSQTASMVLKWRFVESFKHLNVNITIWFSTNHNAATTKKAN